MTGKPRQWGDIAGTPLVHNLILFGRVLRAAGLDISPDRIIQSLRALERVDLRRRDDVRIALRCTFVSHHNQLAVFERAFDAFWNASGTPGDLATEPGATYPVADLMGVEQPGCRAQAPDGSGGTVRRWRPALDAESMPSESEEERVVELDIYSPTDVLRQKDFARLSPAELAEARRLIRAIRWDTTRRRSRRRRSARHGGTIDVRHTLRRSMRHGGEMLERRWRGPRYKRRRLVLLCDISGSMDRYIRLLLHFLHSVEASFAQTEVFVFGTRLDRITRELRHRDADTAIAAASAGVDDWAGGTRIGEALRTFNRRWARRVMGHGSIVIMISDGWDRGDTDLLAIEMERLQRASHRLLWLNPLLGSSDYRPLTQGMQAALPYVDDFLPVHNLASLEALGDLLNRVQEGRPARRLPHSAIRREVSGAAVWP